MGGGSRLRFGDGWKAGEGWMADSCVGGILTQDITWVLCVRLRRKLEEDGMNGESEVNMQYQMLDCLACCVCGAHF